MKNRILLAILIYPIAADLAAQATGNVIYNSNNRFQQNSNYRRSSSGLLYNSAAPSIQYQDNLTYNVNSGAQFSYSRFEANTNEVVMNINVLYNAKPTGYMAIFHINQA